MNEQIPTPQAPVTPTPTATVPPTAPVAAVPPTAPSSAPALAGLTGGMKFGWALLGFFVGIPAILIAWLTSVNVSSRVKSDAIKFSAIGLIVNLAIGLIACISMVGMLSALAAGAASTSSYYF